ncbi:unnamed protein product [Discula destructiva]
MVEQMNDVSLKDLAHHSFVIFVTSTTGQGEFPANATAFWKSLLRKKLPPSCLSHLHYTIFGLGDSSYPKFNWASRKLRKRLLQLGANEVYASGEGDERHDNGIDSIYLPWFQGLKAHLLKEYPLPADLAVIPDDELLPPKYPIMLAEMGSESQEDHWEATREKSAALSHIKTPKTLDEELDDQQRRLHDLRGLGQYARVGGDLSDRLTGSDQSGIDRVRLDNDNLLKDHPKNYNLDESTSPAEKTDLRCIPYPGYSALVGTNQRVTPKEHWQDVRRLVLTITDEQSLPILMPGDLVTIFPKNFPREVNALIDMMSWQSVAEATINWDAAKRGESMRCPRDLHPIENASLHDLLIHNLDITAVPNRTFLKQLRRHTQDEREKERLLELTLEENTQEFYDYTSRPRRTILEVLGDFPGVKIPLEYVLDIFPVIRGRAFSIANYKRSHRDKDAKFHTVELLVALVEYKTIIRKPRQGLCSRYIKSLQSKNEIVVGLSRTSNPPATGDWNSGRPLLAVATGTGIAPVRSVLQERRSWKFVAGHELLFFGCRSEKADYYFKHEWEQESTLQVIPAFSRDPVSASDQASLDPYADKQKRLADSAATLSTDLTRMGLSDSPWLRSTEYDKGKMYVQHQIRRHAREICQIMNIAKSLGVNPIIMICGNAGRMPISVRHALADALVLGGYCKDYEDGAKTLQIIDIWMETW